MSGDDRQNLVRILLAHYDELAGYLARRLGSASAARDALHDTYLRLESIETVPRIDNPRAYVYRVANNIALDRLRADGRRRTRFVAAEYGDDRPSAEPLADSVVEHRQRIALLAQAIDDMPPRQREVFLMHKFDEMTHSQIAERLGISKSMVEKHVSRALALCRDRLSS